MDVYRGPQTVVHRRFRGLQPYLDELKEEGLRPVKSPRFKVLMKHPERDDWAVVVKNRAGEFVLVRGGLDFMFGPPQKDRKSCLGCTAPCSSDCRVFQASLMGLGHKVRPR